jgi:NADPH:quinone reductase-like Zn-dependent oxidoreductase
VDSTKRQCDRALGALSKHPKVGVKQINFGLMDVLIEKGDINALAKLFEAGLWKPHVDPRSPFTLEEVTGAFSLSATGSVVGKVAIVP